MSDEVAKKYLEEYKEKYGSFRIATRLSNGYWKYFVYPSKEYEFFHKYGEECTDRYIFDDEIVIESDKEHITKLPHLTLKFQYDFYMGYIYPILSRNKISHTLWHSSNKSYHIHIFLPALKKYGNLKLIKQLFIRWVLGCDRNCMECKDCEGMYNDCTHCIIKKYDIDMAMCTKHLIRMEGGYHHKSGKHKRLVRTLNFNTPNTMPQEVITQYNTIEKYRVKWELLPPREHTTNDSNSMPCIQWFLNNKLMDYRKRVLFILSAILTKDRIQVVVCNILGAWNTGVQGDYFTVSNINNKVLYCSNKDNKKSMGCRYIREVLCGLNKKDLCNGCTHEVVEVLNQS